MPAWRDDFAQTAAMRGVGWVSLYHDPLDGTLFNWWVSDHEVNHPAGLHPILVLDVFEHAWMVDYGAGERRVRQSLPGQRELGSRGAALQG